MNTEANKIKIPEWLFAGLLSIITGMIVFGIMDVLPWQDKLIFSGDTFEQVVPFPLKQQIHMGHDGCKNLFLSLDMDNL